MKTRPTRLDLASKLRPAPTGKSASKVGSILLASKVPVIDSHIKREGEDEDSYSHLATSVLKTPSNPKVKTLQHDYTIGICGSYQVISTPSGTDRLIPLGSMEATPSPRGHFLYGTPVSVRDCDYYEIQYTRPAVREGSSDGTHGGRSSDLSFADNLQSGSSDANEKQDQIGSVVRPDPSVFASQKIIPRAIARVKKRSLPIPTTPLKRTKNIFFKSLERRRRREDRSCSKSRTFDQTPSLESKGSGTSNAVTPRSTAEGRHGTRGFLVVNVVKFCFSR